MNGRKEGPGDLEFELNDFQKDALNELGNIASCHAVTSLAEMTGVTMNIEVPTVDVVSIEGAEKKIEREKMVAGIFVQLSGGFSGHLLVLFPERSAFSLIDVLMGKTPGETKSIGTEMEESALMEIGNMLASSFCDAIADFFQFSMLPSPPSFSFDMMSAMMENLMVAMAEAEKTEHVILFKCDFKDETEKGIYGYIMLFPHHDSLKNMLSMLEAEVK